MDKNQSFDDPLLDLMGRHANALGEETPVNTNDTTSEKPAQEEDEYGVHDLEKEMAEEDAAIEAAKEARRAEALAAKAEELKVQMPPQSLDKDFQKEAIEFQTTNLQIVSNMVDEVARRHNLTSGGLKTASKEDPDLKMHVMGELMEQYHLNGETITPEFERLVLDNWEGYVDPSLEEGNLDDDNHREKPEEKEEPKGPSDEPVQITVNVEPNTPVTVNVDESLVANMSKSKQVDIRVIEVSEKELRSSKIIHNSQKENIITPFDSDVYDVPLTLPLSGYRCVLRPVNYFEFIQLGSNPASGNRVDADKKQWSIIFNHVKNVSIGEFKNFEDFLKKTKYSDRELLMWGILLAASDEEESVTLRCANPKCRHEHEIKYNPRTIIHVNDELIKKYQWEKTGSVAPGQAAIDHYNELNSTVRRYELPNSKFIVEIDDRPSAYDFLNRRYPLMDELRNRYNGNGSENLTDDEIEENNAEYSYLVAHAMFVTAISIIKDGTEYRYDNWDDIEKIITTSLDMRDAAILMQLVNKVAGSTISPMEFYLENFTCEKCGRHEDRVPIPDIGQTLIFQLARRLSSTEIKLTEMESN